jgi:hypothetical protein
MKAETEALSPEHDAVPRESFAIYPEDWDGPRDRLVETDDGRVMDGRVLVLRAAESAETGQAQAAVDAAIDRILREGVRILPALRATSRLAM